MREESFHFQNSSQLHAGSREAQNMKFFQEKNRLQDQERESVVKKILEEDNGIQNFVKSLKKHIKSLIGVGIKKLFNSQLNRKYKLFQNQAFSKDCLSRCKIDRGVNEFYVQD